MTQHLRDEDLLEVLLDRSSGFNAHLATCSSCRAERERMSRVLGELPALTHIVAQNTDTFWEQQRTAIWAKIDSVEPGKFPVLAWASAAAVLVAATRPPSGQSCMNRMEFGKSGITCATRASSIRTPVAKPGAEIRHPRGQRPVDVG